MSRNLHVVPHDSEWAVKEEGSNRVTSVHKTQKEAIETARVNARDRGGDLIVHGRDGRVRDRDSYSSDRNRYGGNVDSKALGVNDREVRKVLFPVTDSATDKEKIREAVREVVRESRAVN